jgi:hypothetical protein
VPATVARMSNPVRAIVFLVGVGLIVIAAGPP